MKIRKILFQDRYYHIPKHAPYLPISSAQQQARFSFIKEVVEGRYKLETLEKCLCGNDEVEILATYDRLLFPQTILICPRCGLLMNSPRLDKESYGRYYSSGLQSTTLGAYNDYLSNIPKLAKRNPYPAKILNLFKKSKIETNDNWDILDIGAGNGDLLYNFQQLGFENLHGIEPDKCACLAAEKYGIKVDENFIDGFVPVKRYDLVIMVNAFNHLNSPLDALNKIRNQILKPGGYLYIGQIGPLNIIESIWTRTIFRVLQVAHPYNYCIATLNMIVKSAGFECLSSNESVEALYQVGLENGSKMEPDPNAYLNLLRKLEYDNALRRKIWFKVLKRTYRYWFPVWCQIIEFTKMSGLYSIIRRPWRMFLKIFKP